MLDLVRFNTGICGFFMHVDPGSGCSLSGKGSCGPPETSMQHLLGVHADAGMSYGSSCKTFMHQHAIGSTLDALVVISLSCYSSNVA